MKRKTRRLLLRSAGILLALGLASYYLYRQSMYSVIGRDPLWVSMVTEDAGSVSSPNGTTTLYITFHDAGAVHRGNFWTWITVKDWLRGRKLVAEGFSSYPVRYRRAAFPVEWVDEKTFWVTFVDRGAEDPKKILVRLN
jgi:hypothetical protein